MGPVNWKWYTGGALLVLLIAVGGYFYLKPSRAWVTADRVSSSSVEPINVSFAEVSDFDALVLALENADKYGHHTDAFYMDSSTADMLLGMLEEKQDNPITPYHRELFVVRYHFSVRLEEKQQIFSVSISYQKEKPMIA